MGFSSAEYKDIVQRYRPYLADFDASQADLPEIKAYLRHDVEADLHAAVALASLNAELGVRGTFAIQVVSEFYNVFSSENQRCLTQIHEFEQCLALHYYSDFRADPQFNFQDFDAQFELFERALRAAGAPLSHVFSYHRPTTIQLQKSRDRLAPQGFIDCYAPDFFDFTDDLENASVKYMSDSNHEWRFGHPLEVNLNDHNTFQILMHPEEWFHETAFDAFQCIEMQHLKRVRRAMAREYDKYSYTKTAGSNGSEE